MLCDACDAWEGMRWEGGPSGGDICAHRADSLRCTAETSNPGKQIYLLFFFFNKMVMLLKYRWFTVLLVSGIQSDPFYILIFFRFFRLFSTIGYYKILSSLCLLLIYFIYSSLYL